MLLLRLVCIIVAVLEKERRTLYFSYHRYHFQEEETTRSFSRVSARFVRSRSPLLGKVCLINSFATLRRRPQMPARRVDRVKHLSVSARVTEHTQRGIFLLRVIKSRKGERLDSRILQGINWYEGIASSLHTFVAPVVPINKMTNERDLLQTFLNSHGFHLTYFKTWSNSGSTFGRVEIRAET